MKERPSSLGTSWLLMLDVAFEATERRGAALSWRASLLQRAEERPVLGLAELSPRKAGQ